MVTPQSFGGGRTVAGLISGHATTRRSGRPRRRDGGRPHRGPEPRRHAHGAAGRGRSPRGGARPPRRDLAPDGERASRQADRGRAGAGEEVGASPVLQPGRRAGGACARVARPRRAAGARDRREGRLRDAASPASAHLLRSSRRRARRGRDRRARRAGLPRRARRSLRGDSGGRGVAPRARGGSAAGPREPADLRARLHRLE